MLNEAQVLPRAFFERPACQAAPELVGCQLVRELGGQRLRVLITETEAYQGMEDQACHARGGKTRRNAVMFGPPGHAYVYFTYGMHWMLNLVCEAEGFPAAVLIRAVHPLEGHEMLAQNRPHLAGQGAWLDGPAKLTQALGIDRMENGTDACDAESGLFIASGIRFASEDLISGPRVGLGKTPEPWLSMPWRWRLSPRALQAALGTV